MLSGDATLRDPANAVSATVITTGVGPVNPAMLPGDDVQASVEDFAMFLSLRTGRTARKVGAKGGYRPPHRATMSRGEFMRPGDMSVDDSGSSDTEAPMIRREALTCPGALRHRYMVLRRVRS